MNIWDVEEEASPEEHRVDRWCIKRKFQMDVGMVKEGENELRKLHNLEWKKQQMRQLAMENKAKNEKSRLNSQRQAQSQPET